MGVFLQIKASIFKKYLSIYNVSLIIIITFIINLLYGCAAILPCGYSADVSLGKNFDISKKRVAVLPFINSGNTGNKGLNFFVSDHLAQGLMDMGFIIVERQQIQTLFDELKLDMSGNISQSDLIKIGQLSRIDTLVFGSVDYSVWSYAANGVSVRFVDVATGEVFLSGRCDRIRGDISMGVKEICCGIKDKILPQEK